MAFILNSIIKIGKYTFRGGVNGLIIRKSVTVIVDTATLKIPGLGRIVKLKNVINSSLNVIGLGSHQVASDLPNNSVQTAKLFREGDRVSIDLGYNGDLRNEFRGFVRRVNLTTPITIEMEGYAWQLRNKNIMASWKKTTIKEVLERIIQDTDIILSPDIPVINMTSFSIPNKKGIEVLDYFKTKMLLTVYFDDNMLYVGIEEGRTTASMAGVKTLAGLAEVKYNIGYNCIVNQPDLKQRLASDTLIRVRLKTRGKDGKHIIHEAGDTIGEVHDKTIPFSSDSNYLKNMAQARLNQLKYNGYQGKILGFLQPYCKPGWKATLKDKKFEGARAGTYFINATEVTFGIKGATRKVEISYRLDTLQL